MCLERSVRVVAPRERNKTIEARAVSVRWPGNFSAWHYMTEAEDLLYRGQHTLAAAVARIAAELHIHTLAERLGIEPADQYTLGTDLQALMQAGHVEPRLGGNALRLMRVASEAIHGRFVSPLSAAKIIFGLRLFMAANPIESALQVTAAAMDLDLSSAGRGTQPQRHATNGHSTNGHAPAAGNGGAE